MFLQIIQGQVRDAAVFDREAERWPVELKPGATGYLGCTWGLTADGIGFLAAGFDSEAAALANSGRPEQGEWWAAMEKVFADVSFRDCSEIDTMMGGGSDDAGFVQVIQGRVKDQGSARSMMRDAEGQLADSRPDILGGVMAWHGDDGDFTQIVYFRSEAQARSAEDNPGESDVDDQYNDMMAVEPTFFDLAAPRFD